MCDLWRCVYGGHKTLPTCIHRSYAQTLGTYTIAEVLPIEDNFEIFKIVMALADFTTSCVDPARPNYDPADLHADLNYMEHDQMIIFERG